MILKFPLKHLPQPSINVAKREREGGEKNGLRSFLPAKVKQSLRLPPPPHQKPPFHATHFVVMAKVRVVGANIYSAQLLRVYNKFVLARDAQIILATLGGEESWLFLNLNTNCFYCHIFTRGSFSAWCPSAYSY